MVGGSSPDSLHYFISFLFLISLSSYRIEVWHNSVCRAYLNVTFELLRLIDHLIRLTYYHSPPVETQSSSPVTKPPANIKSVELSTSSIARSLASGVTLFIHYSSTNLCQYTILVRIRVPNSMIWCRAILTSGDPVDWTVSFLTGLQVELSS